jgi:hypothetical protein
MIFHAAHNAASRRRFGIVGAHIGSRGGPHDCSPERTKPSRASAGTSVHADRKPGNIDEGAV